MSTQVRRTFVEFFSVGFFFSTISTTQEVGHRDPAKIQVPDGAFAFLFYDIAEMPAHGEPGLVLRSDPYNYSSLYYVHGRVMTLQQVQEEFPDEEIIIDNMKRCGYDRIIRINPGLHAQFGDDCVLLNPET